MRSLSPYVASDSLVCLQNSNSPLGCFVFNTHIMMFCQVFCRAWVMMNNVVKNEHVLHHYPSLLRAELSNHTACFNTQAKQEKGHNYIYNVRAITHRFRHTAVNHCTYKQSAINNNRYDQAAKGKTQGIG